MKTVKGAPVELTREGQQFYDAPIYRTISKPAAFTVACCSAFRFWPSSEPYIIGLTHEEMIEHVKASPDYSSPVPQPIDELSHHVRTRLQWMKPGPDGKLVPR
jgi:hypothetical protein